LRNFWYLAVPGERLRRGETVAVTLLGEPVLIGRNHDGAIFAFLDLCPHQGMPLRYATFKEGALRCCYHGWKFRVEDGRCIEIPSLAANQTGIDSPRFNLRTYPCREVQGNIWVFMALRDNDATPPMPLPPVPTVPGFGDAMPQVTTTELFPCNADQAAIGFVDPAHPPFVHTSRWWKAKSAALRLKEKHYEPTALGFRMTRHGLQDGATPYRLLGRNVAVEITVQLPGIRIEHILGDRHSAGVLTAITPVDAETATVHCCVYWSMRWLAPVKPIARWMARDFLRQDRDVAVKLRDRAAFAPPPLLVGDADAQIKWYFRLKKEFQDSVREQRPFVNPLQPKTLRWRS
jgi:phenylpropionate dioxygenase-like ring-hydroxylating dioxygenase large terminal subunit